jgi:uncharacterized protein
MRNCLWVNCPTKQGNRLRQKQQSCYESWLLHFSNLEVKRDNMKEFIEYIVKNLVETPEDVDVRCYESEKGIIVEVRVGAKDIGKVVGRKGMTIKALRTISTMICARLGHRVRLELVE